MLPVLNTDNQKIVINMDLFYAKPCDIELLVQMQVMKKPFILIE